MATSIQEKTSKEDTGRTAAEMNGSTQNYKKHVKPNEKPTKDMEEKQRKKKKSRIVHVQQAVRLNTRWNREHM